MAAEVTDLDDMTAFDKLPPWARKILSESDRKFKASEILPGVLNGGINQFNLKNVLASAENAAATRERRKQRHHG